mgnify:CR=1 FL=1
MQEKEEEIKFIHDLMNKLTILTAKADMMHMSMQDVPEKLHPHIEKIKKITTDMIKITKERREKLR